MFAPHPVLQQWEIKIRSEEALSWAAALDVGTAHSTLPLRAILLLRGALSGIRLRTSRPINPYATAALRDS
jgi:hypothetical protein